MKNLLIAVLITTLFLSSTVLASNSLARKTPNRGAFLKMKLRMLSASDNTLLLLNVDRKTVFLFFEGLIDGFAQGLQFTDIQACIKDDKKLAMHINNAINHFQKKETRDIRAGFAELSAAVKVIPQAIQDCKAALADVKTIIAMIKKFESPGIFVWNAFKNLVVHGVEIYREVRGALDEWTGKNFVKCGHHFGTAIARVFFDAKPASVAIVAVEQTCEENGVVVKKEELVIAEVTTNDQANLLLAQKDENLIVFPQWKSTKYAEFEGLTQWGFKEQYLGLKTVGFYDVQKGEDQGNMTLPVEFNSIQKWPNCEPEIKKQAPCLASWAIAPSDVLESRICIARGGLKRKPLSWQYLVSCDETANQCKGGSLSKPWKFLESTGITSSTCWGQRGISSNKMQCKAARLLCQADRGFTIKKGSIRYFDSVDSIKREIMSNGPVVAPMRVHADFVNYRSGIYQISPGSPSLGYHAVRIVGWGVELGVPYWKVANSWSKSWGEDGYFRIRQLNNGILPYAIAGLPELSPNTTTFIAL